jgi:hypothetical protein
MSQSSQSTDRPANTFLAYFSDMKCALDLLNQYYTTQKMSTGSAEIDSLIDGVQEGSFYLFYSNHDNQLILDSLLYRQLIGCILPKSGKRHGFESMAVLFIPAWVLSQQWNNTQTNRRHISETSCKYHHKFEAECE